MFIEDANVFTADFGKPCSSGAYAFNGILSTPDETINMGGINVITTMFELLLASSDVQGGAIVTGANTGIGYWTVVGLLEAGAATVVITCRDQAKLRDTIAVERGTDKEAVEALALASPKVLAQLAGASPRKIIVVPDRLVNIVA